jgi:hypothetical protein
LHIQDCYQTYGNSCGSNEWKNSHGHVLLDKNT